MQRIYLYGIKKAKACLLPKKGFMCLYALIVYNNNNNDNNK